MLTCEWKAGARRLALAGLAAGVLVLAGCDDGGIGGLFSSGPMSYESATSKLADMAEDVNWRENIVQRRARIDLGAKADLKETLPDIASFQMVVDPQATPGDVTVEIFSSTEKAGSGTDGWLVEVATAFNASNARLANGKTVRVRVRKIASGTGYQFIASGKHRPHAFTPSNHLWVKMAEAHGVRMTPIRERLVGNTAGIVMKTEAFEKLESVYRTVGVGSVIDAVVQGQFVMGYTNPFASSTGLNFLVTVLATFGGGDESKMLSPEVVSAFQSFQRGVPFVALTTLQMRDSVERGGSLDAFVMEYQTFVKTEALKVGYEFMSFGTPHNNPLYAVGDAGAEVMEALELLAVFAEQEQYAKLATRYGFNVALDYNPPFAVPPGALLVQAQALWKEKKDAGRPIAAVFLVDTSGSMGGTRLRGVKQALKQGSEFITPTNSIGIVLFDDAVSVVLPIAPFNVNHKASFLAAVEDMDASGGTAMYNGIAVALNLLVEEKKNNPQVKPMLFVLTDGATKSGLAFSDIEAVIEGVGIPVYTIGYAADLEELGRLSLLVEAATLNADEGEISYKIGSLLNAQM